MKTAKIFINLATVLFSGCIFYPIYDYSYYDFGKIASLITDWKERGDGIDIPERYTVKIGDYINILSGTHNPIENPFPAGKYIINIWNVAHHIAISDRIATADYTAGELGWLFTGRQELKIEIDRKHSIIVYMRQQVRQLTLELDIAENIKDRLTAVDAALSGVAGTLNIDDGTHDAPTSIALTFAEDLRDGKWKATVRLLGVTGKTQTLALSMNLAEGNLSPYTITSDLSSLLASFNEDKKTPLTLSTQIVGTETGGELIATITGWISEETTTGTAD